jgi:hypothetical protein
MSFLSTILIIKNKIMKLELKHLAPYLPYKLRIKRIDYEHKNLFLLGIYFYDVVHQLGRTPFDFIKPILRPLSELEEFSPAIHNYLIKNCENYVVRLQQIDYIVLIENHFDVFGLIEKGLAISIHDVE